ncbi:MAG: hypothetical protein DHS20C15_28260 [Planctomycetota bacterium]|nr:MAG: hypothetical protein DHS20C15_28260 [Planctomycetota bacterium]
MVVALTGLGLLGFVFAHLAGNLQVFLGREALNAYAQGLKDLGALLWVARLGLIAMFVTHVALALQLARENRAARPTRYVHGGVQQASPGSRSMVFTGVMILLFVAYHLAHFTFGAAHASHYAVGSDALGRHDVYGMVVAGFSEPLVVGLYVAAIAMLALHLSHGVQSVFQTLGLNGPRYEPIIKRTGCAIAVIVFVGNVSMPLAILMGLGPFSTGA